MKSIKYIIFILLGVVLLFFFFTQRKTEAPHVVVNNISDDIFEQNKPDVINQENLEKKKEENMASVTFTGILEEVNTGCFADGECFIVVDGSKVTAIEGRKQGPLGKTIINDDINAGFGDLYVFLGEEIEVYARQISENEFTLYGSEDYYIKK